MMYIAKKIRDYAEKQYKYILQHELIEDKAHFLQFLQQINHE